MIPLVKTHLTHSMLIESRECRYESGLVEIGFYSPEILPGAGRILQAVVDRMPGNRKWFVHAQRNRAFSSTSKDKAIAFALEETQRRASVPRARVNRNFSDGGHYDAGDGPILYRS